MEEERKEHRQKMKKMEAEMEQVFEIKVKEKMQKLKDSETDLQRRAEQMKKSLEQQKAELEQRELLSLKRKDCGRVRIRVMRTCEWYSDV
ncbi:hypothetical protein EB796_011273 [Bugula neritina]|uniref:Uncharacterized protein n=1 Tax=Bugula neritina TaxID=10212 RepID=A0A7J7JVM0_BUGNE|nr:hypothetical protein EB796_011273 [Bugula neritina]